MKRCTTVGDPEPKELADAIKASIKIAQTTVCEYQFMEGLFLSIASIDAAKANLNSTLGKMELAQIQQTDINVPLWQLVAKVCSGIPLQ